MKRDDSLKPDGPWEVRRKIRLPSLRHAADGMAVERAIGEMPGVLAVTAEVDRQRVVVRYNASRQNYRNIMEIAEKTGFPALNSWWSRFKGNWYRFTDENARDNAKAPPPACCSKPPK
jgi:copper chaperone CopZ